MPRGQLFINERDAYDTWGISMDSSALSALMTPAPMKNYIKNESRMSHGSDVLVNNPKVDSRDISITFNLSARNEEDFFAKYLSFCKELETGVLNIKTSFQPDVIYRMNYITCSQFTQFMRGIAKFSLKLNEPNPKNRSL